MTALSRPQPYKRGLRPTLGGDVEFLMEEFRKVEQSLSDLCALVPQEANSAPDKPRACMIRLARAPWRPVGGTVDRMVYWDGAAWVAI